MRGVAAILCVGSAFAAEWHVHDPTALGGIDGLVGDDPILMLSVDAEDGEYLDVKLERVDPLTGLLQKAEFDEVGCGQPWRHAVRGRSMTRGDSMMWFLTSRMPPGAYAVVDRASGGNAGWEMQGDPFWVVTQPVSRVVPCHDGHSRISIARQPAVLAARERVMKSTVRIRAGERVGQGVVINPWGHVLTAASLVAGQDEVAVGFPSGVFGGMGDRVLRYASVSVASDTVVGTLPEWASSEAKLSVLVPIEDEGLPRFMPEFAPLVDRARLVEGSELTFRHAQWMYANRRGSGEPIYLDPQTPSGERAPDLATAGPLLKVKGPVEDADIGGPVYDHVGRVWGVLVSKDEAQWSTLVVEQYLNWVREGSAPLIRGPIPQEGSP